MRSQSQFSFVVSLNRTLVEALCNQSSASALSGHIALEYCNGHCNIPDYGSPQVHLSNLELNPKNVDGALQAEIHQRTSLVDSLLQTLITAVIVNNSLPQDVVIFVCNISSFLPNF